MTDLVLCILSAVLFKWGWIHLSLCRTEAPSFATASRPDVEYSGPVANQLHRQGLQTPTEYSRRYLNQILGRQFQSADSSGDSRTICADGE